MKCFRMNLNQLPKVILWNKEVLIPPKMHCSRQMEEYALYVVTNGKLQLNVNGSTVSFTAGDVCLFQQGDWQEAIESSFCEYYYVHFHMQDITEMELENHEYTDLIKKKYRKCMRSAWLNIENYEFLNVVLRQIHHIPEGEEWRNIIDILQNNIIAPEFKMPEKRLSVSSALSQIFIKLEKNYTNENIGNEKDRNAPYYLARQIALYIEENFDKAITGEEIQKIFYLNYDYANRIFRQYMGYTLIKYRNMIRMQRAKDMLRETDLSIKEIAIEIGFENVHYFSRYFKKTEGASPSEYRKYNSI